MTVWLNGSSSTYRKTGLCAIFAHLCLQTGRVDGQADVEDRALPRRALEPERSAMRFGQPL